MEQQQKDSRAQVGQPPREPQSSIHRPGLTFQTVLIKTTALKLTAVCLRQHKHVQNPVVGVSVHELSCPFFLLFFVCFGPRFVDKLETEGLDKPVSEERWSNKVFLMKT